MAPRYNAHATHRNTDLNIWLCSNLDDNFTSIIMQICQLRVS